MLIDRDKLERLAQALNSKSSASIKNEEQRALSAELNLQDHINEVKGMFDGKSIKYITQAQYDQLTDEEKDDPSKAYFITDAEDLSHEHVNKDFLDGLSPELLEAKQDKTDERLTTQNKTIVGAINELDNSVGGIGVLSQGLIMNVQDLTNNKSDKLHYECFALHKEYTENDMLNENLYKEDYPNICMMQLNSSFGAVDGETYQFTITFDDGSIIKDTAVCGSYAHFPGAGVLVFDNIYGTVYDRVGYLNDSNININNMPDMNIDRTIIECMAESSGRIITNVKIEAITTLNVDDTFLKTNRFITEEERKYWNNKADKAIYRVREDLFTTTNLTLTSTNYSSTEWKAQWYTSSGRFDIPEGNYTYEVILKTNNGETIIKDVVNGAISPTGNEMYPILMKNEDINGVYCYLDIRPGLTQSNTVDNSLTSFVLRYPAEYGTSILITDIKIISIKEDFINEKFYEDHRFITEEEREQWNNGADKLIYESVEPELYATVDNTNMTELQSGSVRMKQIDRLNLVEGKEYRVTLIHDNKSSSFVGVSDTLTSDGTSFDVVCLSTMHELIAIEILDGMSFDAGVGEAIPNENSAVVVVFDITEGSMVLDFELIIIESIEEVKSTKEVNSKFLETHRFVTESEKIRWNNKNDKLFYNVEEQNNTLQIIESYIESEDDVIMFMAMAQQVDLVSDSKYKIKVTDDNGETFSIISSVITDNSIGKALAAEGATYEILFISDYSAIYPEAPAGVSFVQLVSTEFSSVSKIEINEIAEYEVNNEFLETHRFITEEEREQWNNKADVSMVNDVLDTAFEYVDEKQDKIDENLITTSKNITEAINEIAEHAPSVISEEVLLEVSKEQLEAAWNANPTIGGDSSTYIEVPLLNIVDDNQYNYKIFINGKEYPIGYLGTEEHDNFTRWNIEFYRVDDIENNIMGGYYGTHYDIDWNDSTTSGILKIDRDDRDKPPVFTSEFKLIRRVIKKLENKYLEDDLVVNRSISMLECDATGECSTAFGSLSKALEYGSHAEGVSTVASGYASHAEGQGTSANGQFSHVEGLSSKANGQASHAEGNNTIASGQSQHVQGMYNIEDTEKKYAHIVGNGDYVKRSNAHTLDWKGNAWFAGNVSINGTPTEANDLVTKNYVDEKTSAIDAITLNGYSLWVGTTTELEAIGQKDPNTLYFEIDDGTEDEVVQVDVVNGVLTLTADKYQKTNMINGTQIVFPEVNRFTEIHLYFRSDENMSLNFPDNARWRLDKNIEEGKSYEIVCTYNTIEWLVNIIVYS